ncbi:hypothetical protein ACFE04_007969 [Oxalis oulophora]
MAESTTSRVNALEVASTEEEEERTWRRYFDELKISSHLAASMIAVSLLQYMLQVVSTIFVGHLDGVLPLASVSIAISFTNVTGFSLLSGLAGGLETLCGQAYGAQEYKKLGVYTYNAIFSHFICCIPICVLWVFLGKLLPLLGQDPTISHHACKYAIYLIPALFGAAILKVLTRYLQTQSLTLAMLLTAGFVLCVHAPVCWVLVFRTNLGYLGAAVAFNISTWLNVIMLTLYIVYSPACEKTRAPLSKDAFLGIPKFFRFAIPAALMVCLKWWSMELLTLLSGLLPNPKLQTSVLSICLTISTLHFTIAYGFGAATSTRVSNELGAGNPHNARIAVRATMFVAVLESIMIATALFFCRYIVGYVYSSQKQVVDAIAGLLPLVCVSVLTDSMQAVLSGVAKGCGWQRTGAYVNLGAFYFVGLPVGALLGLKTHLRAKGLWIGIVVGSILQTIVLAIITAVTDWRKQASKARERVGGEQEPTTQ